MKDSQILLAAELVIHEAAISSDSIGGESCDLDFYYKTLENGDVVTLPLDRALKETIYNVYVGPFFDQIDQILDAYENSEVESAKGLFCKLIETSTNRALYAYYILTNFGRPPLTPYSISTEISHDEQ